MGVTMGAFVESSGGPIVRRGIKFVPPTRAVIAEQIARWAAQDTEIFIRALVTGGRSIESIGQEAWEHQRVLASFPVALASLSRFDRAVEVCSVASGNADLSAFTPDELSEIAAELWGQKPVKGDGAKRPLEESRSDDSPAKTLIGDGVTASSDPSTASTRPV